MSNFKIYHVVGSPNGDSSTVNAHTYTTLDGWIHFWDAKGLPEGSFLRSDVIKVEKLAN